METLQTLDVMTVLLVDAAVKSTILLLFAWFAVRCLTHSSAAVRHAIWGLALVAIVLMPVASAVLPEWRLPILPAETTKVDSTAAAIQTNPIETTNSALVAEVPQPEDQISATPLPNARHLPQNSRPASTTAAEDVSFQDSSKPQETPTSAPLTLRQWASIGVVSAWILGVILGGGGLLVGMVRTIRLRRQTVFLVDPNWIELAQALKQQLQLRRSVALREHPDAVVPMTWGIVRPEVLIPRQACAWDESMRRTVLLHELAHVRRGDVLIQLIGRIACVLYWFNPLAWSALKGLRQEREQACDDVVVQSGEKASDYADKLLQVARQCGMPPGLSLGVAMAEGSSLENRVKSLFDPARGHGPLRRAVALGFLSIAGISLCMLSPVKLVTAAASTAGEARNSEDSGKQFYESLPDGALRGEAALERMLVLKPQFSPIQKGVQFAAVYSTPQRIFRENERIPTELFLRNAGREPVRLSFLLANFMFPPVLENSRSEPVALSIRYVLYAIAPFQVTLQPGEICVIPGVGIGIGSQQSAPSFENPQVDQYRLTYQLTVKSLDADGHELWNQGMKAALYPWKSSKRSLESSTFELRESAAEVWSRRSVWRCSSRCSVKQNGGSSWAWRSRRRKKLSRSRGGFRSICSTVTLATRR